MAVTLSSSAAAAACDAIVDLVDGATGGNARLRLYQDTTLLVTITLGDPAFGNANSFGIAEASGLPKEGVCIHDGAANTFQLQNGNGTVVAFGTVTGTGGGGDLTISPKNTLATGDIVTLISQHAQVPA